MTRIPEIESRVPGEQARPASGRPTLRAVGRHLAEGLQAAALLFVVARLGPEGLRALVRPQAPTPTAPAPAEPAKAPAPPAAPLALAVRDQARPPAPETPPAPPQAPAKPPVPRVPIGFETPKETAKAEPPVIPEPEEFSLPDRVPPPLPEPPPRPAPARRPLVMPRPAPAIRVVQTPPIYRHYWAGRGPRIIEIPRPPDEFPPARAAAPAPAGRFGAGNEPPSEAAIARAWADDVKKLRTMKGNGSDEASIRRAFGPAYGDLSWAAMLDVPPDRLPGPTKAYADALRSEAQGARR